MVHSLTKYFSLAEQDEASEKLLGTREDYPAPQVVNRSRLWPWVTHGALFCLYTVMFIGLSLRSMTPTTSQCVSKLSTYSPAHDAVEYYRVRYNGSLNFPSPWRGPPNPSVDAAWDRISTNNTLHTIRISDDMLKKVYKSGRASSVKYRFDDGGGNMGSIEVFHQLHCLNMLRKYTFPDYYPELQNLWHTRPEFLRSHLDHCIEIIRQNLMCAADVGIITYDWVKGWELPFPDFNTWHRCRNFDKILEWSDTHSVHIPKDHIRRLGYEVDLPAPPE